MVVRSLDEARAALAVGKSEGIESPYGAAGLHGIGWWREMLGILRAEFGDFPSVLDCADAPGLALAAIRDGIPCIRLDAEDEVFAKVKAIGDAAGTTVLR